MLKEIRHNPMLWLLVFVPVVFAAQNLKPGAHTLLFALSVLAIVPLAALLSRATESVAAKTGDAIGGLLNATLGNLTELVIALGSASQIALFVAPVLVLLRETDAVAYLRKPFDQQLLLDPLEAGRRAYRSYLEKKG